MDAIPGLLAALALAAVHIFSRLLRVLDEIPRHRFLSLAGGVTVAYVALRLLPGLSQAQATFERTREAALVPFVRDHVYVVVLAAILLFFGLDRLSKRSRQARRREAGQDRAGAGAFLLQISSFALLNFLVGYIIHVRAALGARALALFAVAFLLKFIVNDHGLYADHKEAYDRAGRWLLAACVLAGWGVGLAARLPELGPVLLQAFVAGGTLFNVLKEELPLERESRFAPFALGAAAYAALLLAL